MTLEASHLEIRIDLNIKTNVSTLVIKKFSGRSGYHFQETIINSSLNLFRDTPCEVDLTK
jgi:hypothetical protein